MTVRENLIVATAGLVMAAGLALAPAADALTTAQATPVTTATQQNCWYGGTHTPQGGGGKMQYWECRRNYHGTIQSSVSMRVEDIRNDRQCVEGHARIGNNTRTAWNRLFVTGCSTGHWTAWKRSGWWNGRQAYEYVYRV